MRAFLRSFAAVLGLVIALNAVALPAHALAPKDAVSTCDLDGLLKQLAGIKQDGSTTSVQTELDLRKEILTRSMDCNAHEATTFADTVGALDGGTRVGTSLRKKYEGGLRDAAAFATKESKLASTLTTVSSTKDLAVTLKAWRADTYNPLSWQAAQLVIIDRNLDLAGSANDRVAQLSASLGALGDVQGASAVQDEITQADKLIADSDAKLNDALLQLRDNPTTAQDAIIADQKTGLDGLSQAYKLLLDANTKITELTPAQ